MKKFCVTCFSIFYAFSLMSSSLSWNAPTTLSTAGINATSPQVVMDSQGNLTAIWVENGAIKANFMQSGGSWGIATTLAASNGSSPVIGVDNSGNTTAAWVVNGTIHSATAPNATGVWGIPSTISSANSSSPAIAVQPSGNIVIMWVTNGYVEASTKILGGLLSAVTTVSGANSSHPAIAVGSNGKVVAVWCNLAASGTTVLQSSTQTALGGVWTTPINLVQVTPAYNYGFPSVAVDANGNAVALGYRYQIDNGQYINVALYGTLLPSGASQWQAIPTLLSLSQGLRNPADLFSKVVFDSVGNAAALWAMSYDGSAFSIESSTLPLGGIWGSTVELANTLYAFGGDLSANSLGDVVGSFMYWDGSNLTIQSREANISGTNQGNINWNTPIEISTLMGNSYPKVASMYSNGQINAATIWESFDGTSTTIQVATGSRSTTSPPTNLTATSSATNLGVYTDNSVTLSWSPSPSPNLIEYVIYINGVTFTFTGSNVQTATIHSIDNPLTSVTYGVAAVDNDLTQSQTITVTYP